MDKLNINKKMRFKLFALLLILSLFSVIEMYAKGDAVIKGNVKEKATGLPMIGATVFIESISKAAMTDENGDYVLSGLEYGVYDVKVTFFTFKDIIVPGVRLSDDAGQNEVIINVEMEEDAQMLNEVVVQGVKREDTEISAINAVRTSSVVMSAVSSAEISKTPDRNAAEVVKRVPGVSIVDDRFVVVRGLPQRYNNVWLNNSSVPGSEPDTRSFSFDMLPTSQIDNIMIVKSPNAELPAEFSGGFLRIHSKSVPDKNGLSVQYSTGANAMTAFKDFVSINKDNWQTKTINPMPDQKIGVQGNMVKEFDNGNMFGLTATAEYSHQYRAITDMSNIRYGVYNVREDKPEALYDYTDNSYTSSDKVSALLNGTYIWGDNKIMVRNLFNRTYKDKYTTREGWQNLSARYDQEKYEYSSSTRTILTSQVAGEHIFKKAVQDKVDNKLDWNVSYSYSAKNDPDRRIINLQENTFAGDKYFGQMAFEQNEITRDNTDLREDVLTAGLNYNHAFENSLADSPIEFKAGFYGEYRDRKYTVESFTYRYNQANLPEDFKYRDPISEILIPENMADDKLYLYDDTDMRDSYMGVDMLGAAYAQVLYPVGKFKVNAGARFEARNMVLTSYTRINDDATKDKTYNQMNVFPSVNISYNATEKHIFRLAYGMSTNRQEFRELSSSVYYDFDLFSDVIGNPDLKPAIVQNADIKYEFYVTPKEYVSVAVFYKHFKNPIEWTYLDAGGSYTYTFENAESATNYGIEFDVRKSLDFIGMENLTLGFNASLIQSMVEFDNENSLEKDRPMQGQSPYLINTSLFYDIPSIDLQLGLLYNRIGKRIMGIGRQDTSSGDTSINNDLPDTYEMPRDLLDFVVSKRFGKGFTVKANIKDILNQPVQFAQFPKFLDENNVVQERMQIAKEFKLGTSFSISLQYNF